MALELDVKIRKDGLVISDVVKAISAQWDALRIGEALTILNVSELNLGQAVSSECPPIDIEVTENAYVRCFFYNVEQWPRDSQYDEESGLLCSFSAGTRNKETVLLMSVAAAAVAELAGSKVIDERGLVGLGRMANVQALIEKIGRVTGMRFPDAAKAFVPGYS